LNDILVEEFDVIVVGAGFCGSALVVILRARSPDLNIKIIDRNPTYPPIFRAEKLESHQYDAMVAFEIQDYVRPIDPTFIDEVIVMQGNRESVQPQTNHRGMDYTATVNQFRTELIRNQLLEIANIASAVETESGYELCLSDNRTLRAKLLVVSTGVDARLIKQLGISDHPGEPLRTTCFGFDIESSTENGFPHQAFNIRPQPQNKGLDFVTFFPIGSRMRVNVFTCWEPGSPEALQFKKRPIEWMNQIFPLSEERIGRMRLIGKVQSYSGTYYRRNCTGIDGLVILGDAYQSISPATGMGISKCLADISSVLKCIGEWDFQSTTRVETRSFYECVDKENVDDKALSTWVWSNRRSSSNSVCVQLELMRENLRKTKFGKIAVELKAYLKRMR
jgi:2-polyprenyl-6-methoxyphenol hydroxylase-like FAD-dependent oxidoreductase